MQLLHSKILGNGKPLLILHGFLGMSDNWKTLGNQYAATGFEVHLIDQRNHGKSFWSTDFDYAVMAQDLKAYIARYKLTDIHLLGHSMGGKTAMKFTCSYPGIVKKLIIADIAPKYYPPHHKTILDALNTLDFSNIQSRGAADEQLAQHLKDMGVRQFLLKNLFWKEKGVLAFRFNLPVLRNKMEQIGENIERTDTFAGATLFLSGSKSDYITAADKNGIRHHFPNSEIQTIDNAGHWLHAENPKQFFEKSIDFLNKNL